MKKLNIYGTLGPACQKVEVLEKMFHDRQGSCAVGETVVLKKTTDFRRDAALPFLMPAEYRQSPSGEKYAGGKYGTKTFGSKAG